MHLIEIDKFKHISYKFSVLQFFSCIVDGGSGDCNMEFPLFQTGLGRVVSVKQNSVEKAYALLGTHNIGIRFLSSIVKMVLIVISLE